MHLATHAAPFLTARTGAARCPPTEWHSPQRCWCGHEGPGSPHVLWPRHSQNAAHAEGLVSNCTCMDFQDEAMKGPPNTVGNFGDGSLNVLFPVLEFWL